MWIAVQSALTLNQYALGGRAFPWPLSPPPSHVRRGCPEATSYNHRPRSKHVRAKKTLDMRVVGALGIQKVKM